MSNHIYLIGPMGVGKTTIGRKLANELALNFYDCDQIIEAKNGVSIATIFEIEGEQSFRLKESAVIREIAAFSRCVVSTGGGVVVKQENIDVMKAHGTIIYLHASFALLWQRLKDCRARPLLQVESPQQAIRELFKLREPLYRQAADEIINVDANSIATTIDGIKQLIEEKQ